MRFERISTGEGLSQATVTAILQDRTGFLWFGTQDGLNRFDGSGFEIFRNDPNDPGSLGNTWVQALLESPSGDIWIATRGGGLNRWLRDRDAFERWRHDPDDPTSVAADQQRALLRDGDDLLWVGTEESGLDRFDPASGGFTHFRHDRQDPASLSDDRVRALLEDSSGRLWVGTDSGLNLMRADGTFAHYRHDPGDLESLGNDRVDWLLEDRGGVLWIGTEGAGVSKWDPRKWLFSNDSVRPSDLGNASVLALTLDGAGRLWIGTAGGGVDVVDRESGELTRYRHDPTDPTSLSADLVTAMTTDRRGTVWVGTMSGGLNRFDAASGTFTRYRHDPARPDSLGHDGVMTLYEDPSGNLWAGTYGGGVNRLRSDGGFDRWRHDPDDPETLSNDRVTAFAARPDGTLWVGTFGGGVNWFDPASGRFVRVRNEPERPTSLSHNSVWMMLVDEDGVLWVGTQGGLDRLVRFDEATGEAHFRRYGVADGLAGQFVFAILPDREGNLWISTNSGLSRFDPRTETFKNYDASHGLQSDEFNMMAYARGRDGELFFGGILGFNSFYPERISENTTVPPVVLTSFSKLNRPVKLGRPISDVEELVLDWRDSVISFEFAALDFTAPEKNQYRYMLEGFDDNWIDHGNRRRVTFTNLDPGTYTLRVQGSNNDGVWNQDGIALRLVIPPPFWATLWFRALVGLGAVGLVFLGYGLRTRAIRKRSSELEALVDERTRELAAAQEQLVRKERLAVLGELAGSVAHELRNPLGVLRNSAYFLKLTATGGEKTAHHLELIEREIERSNGIITELLDYGRDPKPERRRFALQEVAERALERVRVPGAIRVRRDLPPAPVLVDADPDQIERMLVNLIRNAVQAMSAGGELAVACGMESGNAVVTVADTGVGIDPEALSKIFEPLYTGKAKGIGLGLPVSQRYADLNGGRIECESERGKGSTFRLVLPMANDGAGASVPDAATA